MFLGKSVLKICSKFTRKHSSWSVISINLRSNFIEITLGHGCSTVYLLHVFKTPFPKNTCGGLLLYKSPLTSKRTFVHFTDTPTVEKHWNKKLKSEWKTKNWNKKLITKTVLWKMFVQLKSSFLKISPKNWSLSNFEEHAETE